MEPGHGHPAHQKGVNIELFVAGNLSGASDAFGPLNAGWGEVIHFTESGEMDTAARSGFRAPGEVRNLRLISGHLDQIIAVRSNDVPLLFKVEGFPAR